VPGLDDDIGRQRWVAHRELHAGEKELDLQKWEAHREQHSSIARNLTEYKSQSNEWRGSLSDLRGTFATKAELEALNIRLDSVQKIMDRFEGSLNTWRGIAAFLGLGGVGAVVWAILQAKP